MKLSFTRVMADLGVSPPIRGRGLKLPTGMPALCARPSPPIRGRGLKLLVRFFFREKIKSPPIRGRGLKPGRPRHHMAGLPSPPIRGRGLKQRKGRPFPILPCVAPHTGAWIETSSTSTTIRNGPVAPHTGAWIETSQCVTRSLGLLRRPPYGGVD